METAESGSEELDAVRERRAGVDELDAVVGAQRDGRNGGDAGARRLGAGGSGGAMC